MRYQLRVEEIPKTKNSFIVNGKFKTLMLNDEDDLPYLHGVNQWYQLDDPGFKLSIWKKMYASVEKWLAEDPKNRIALTIGAGCKGYDQVSYVASLPFNVLVSRLLKRNCSLSQAWIRNYQQYGEPITGYLDDEQLASTIAFHLTESYRKLEFKPQFILPDEDVLTMEQAIEKVCPVSKAGIVPFRFYQDKDNFRVTFLLGMDRFMVVKLNKNDLCATVKFWRGDYEKTESLWSTKLFVPNPTTESFILMAARIAVSEIVEKSPPLDFSGLNELPPQKLTMDSRVIVNEFLENQKRNDE